MSGPPVGVPTPPVVAILIQSAPARTISRTFRRQPSTPSQTPSGIVASFGNVESTPAGSVWSL